MIWTDADLPVIYSAADACVQFIIDGLKDARGVHLETAIALAASLAGISILRSAVKEQKINLSELIRTKPGTPVFVDKANDIGQEVTQFMVAFCQPMRINPQSGWTEKVPADHNPLRNPPDLVSDFEKPFITLMDQQHVKAELRPFVGGLAALKLIVMGKDVLNPEIGKALIMASMVRCSKTVPTT